LKSGKIGVEYAGDQAVRAIRMAFGRPRSTVFEEVEQNGKRHQPELTPFQSNRDLVDHVESRPKTLDSSTRIALELARAWWPTAEVESRVATNGLLR
jgi:hypothetical protein